MSRHSRTASGSWRHVRYPTTCVRAGTNPDYGTEEFAVLWCEWVDEEEQPVFDEEGALVTDEDENVVMELAKLDRPKYEETRLAGFPTFREASRHAATVRAMRYA